MQVGWNAWPVRYTGGWPLAHPPWRTLSWLPGRSAQLHASCIRVSAAVACLMLAQSCVEVLQERLAVPLAGAPIPVVETDLAAEVQHQRFERWRRIEFETHCVKFVLRGALPNRYELARAKPGTGEQPRSLTRQEECNKYPFLLRSRRCRSGENPEAVFSSPLLASGRFAAALFSGHGHRYPMACKTG